MKSIYDDFSTTQFPNLKTLGCYGYFERFLGNSVPESLTVPLPIHKIHPLNYEEVIT